MCRNVIRIWDDLKRRDVITVEFQTEVRERVVIPLSALNEQNSHRSSFAINFRFAP